MSPAVYEAQAIASVLATSARSAGFAVLVPLFGLCPGGVRRRSLLAVVLALMLTPSMCARAGARAAELEPGSSFVLITAGELGAGLVLGFALRVLASGVAQAAQLLQLQVGIAPSAVSDEDDAEPLVRLHQITGLAMFFAWGGHRAAVAALLDLPAIRFMTDDGGSAFVATLVDTLSQACWLGVTVAAPTAAALLTTRVVLELAARVMPQFGGEAIAAPIQAAIGLGLLVLSLSGLRAVVGAGWFQFASRLAVLP